MLSPATRARHPRRALIALTAVSAAVTLGGCGALQDGAGGDGREVVASFYPLAWVTEQVAGDDWTVTNLTTPGGEPHDLELGIGATADVADADLVVYLDGFQPAVDDAVATNAGGETLDAADVVDLQPVTDHAGDDHAEEHDHGDLDPHFWLDPLRMADLGDAVADELAALDPDGAPDYRDRASQLRSQLEDLDGDYESGLASCELDTVVVSHDAFGYLARYGLHLEPINGLSPDAEPNPATLAELAGVIEDEGVTTVFSERLASPALAETLASDLDVDTGVLDPIEGLTSETTDEDYPSLMRENLDALQEANRC
ncbi:zinc ABC transporter substrate-binding protein [Nocardioides aestuarii]|uniref:Metal ABC transporter substrate-binding protein n=1 Tax=Nocardioides aestuarii TaxID=252231 RepID=A0ABW4TSG3_9ACTN